MRIELGAVNGPNIRVRPPERFLHHLESGREPTPGVGRGLVGAIRAQEGATGRVPLALGVARPFGIEEERDVFDLAHPSAAPGPVVQQRQPGLPSSLRDSRPRLDRDAACRQRPSRRQDGD